MTDYPGVLLSIQNELIILLNCRRKRV